MLADCRPSSCGCAVNDARYLVLLTGVCDCRSEGTSIGSYEIHKDERIVPLVHFLGAWLAGEVIPLVIFQSLIPPTSGPSVPRWFPYLKLAPSVYTSVGQVTLKAATDRTSHRMARRRELVLRHVCCVRLRLRRLLLYHASGTRCDLYITKLRR